MIKKILSKGLLSLIVLLSATIISNACTNFLITRGASKDGSTMITYAADSHTLFGELYFWPAADYPEGSFFDVYEWDTGKYLGKIKQVSHTYSVVGNMNEFQLAIAETTYGGKDELVNPQGIIDYGSLIYITLQRAKTAREAIKIMAALVNEYGYASSGESFSISDPDEVWIMDMIGKGPGVKGANWVARRVPDGYISGHANAARIRQFPLSDKLNCYYDPTMIEFAREKGYFAKDKRNSEFSFVDAFAPADFHTTRFCEARVWAGFNKVNGKMGAYQDYATGANVKNVMPLWIKPDKKLSVQDVMNMMRDHYEGTVLDMTQDVGAGPFQKPYRWRPLTWKVDGVEYCNERAIATQQTGFSFVTQSRKNLPNPIGGILWFGVDDASSTVYTPMYCGITKVPETFAVGKGSMMEFDPDAAFWVFNQVSNLAYTRYSFIHPEIQKAQLELENSYIALTSEVDKKAGELYLSNKEQAIKYITDFSVTQGNNTVKKWQGLYAYLFTSYMDGNIKTKKEVPVNYKYIAPEVKQPGYDENWKKSVIEQKGELLKVNVDEGKGH